jgi:ABC-type multidrug transport system fused ATPase/permease subunit
MKFSTLLQHVTPQRNTLLFIMLLLLLDSAVALANPWLAGMLTKSILQGEGSGLPAFQFILLAWFGLLALRSLLSFATSYLVGSTGETMSARLRSRVYEHLQILPMSYYHERKPVNIDATGL